MTSTASAKGQVVIPAELRREFGIKTGTKLSFYEDGGRLVLQPITKEFVRSVRGSSFFGASGT